MQQFEHLVEPGGVGGPRRADREDLVQVVVIAEDVGVDQGLTGAHPVLVAGDGVDLAVVRDPAERVGQRPRRERVRGEPRVHDAQRALQPVVLQVEVERLELRRGQHALVDERLTGKAWEIDGFTARTVLARTLGAQLVLGTLADHVGAALEFHPGCAADEQLAEGRHGVAGQGTQRRLVGGNVAPAEQVQSLGLDDLLHGRARGGGVLGRLRQEGDSGGIAAGLGQIEPLVVADRAQELVRHLKQDARAVAGVRLGALGAAVLEVQQRGDGLVHDVAAAATVHVHDHGHTTRVVLVCGVVQPDTAGHSHLTLHEDLWRSPDRATRRKRAGPLRSGLSRVVATRPPCSAERRPFQSGHDKW